MAVHPALFVRWTALICLAPVLFGVSSDKFAFAPMDLFGLQGISGPVDISAGLFRLCFHWIFHDGGEHLFTNLIALTLFGAATENLLGVKRTATIFAASIILAALTEGYVATDRLAWMVGASGGISGLMGALLAMRPWAKLRLGVRSADRYALHAPIMALCLIDVCANAGLGFIAWSGAGPFEETVAWRGHLAGYACGFLTGWIWRRQTFDADNPMIIAISSGFYRQAGWKSNLLTALVWSAAVLAGIKSAVS